jgi:predicted O-methyltransferase YrrM
MAESIQCLKRDKAAGIPKSMPTDPLVDSTSRGRQTGAALAAIARRLFGRHHSRQDQTGESMGDQGHIFEFDWFSWNIPLFEQHLAHLRNKECSLLEVGCHEGRATTWLLENIATHPRATITCVDMFEQPNFRHNVRVSGSESRVDLRLGLSREVLRLLPLDSYDFVYIDGSHAVVDVLEDAVLAFRLVKCGAPIAFDDYLWDDPEFNQKGVPKPAIDAFLELYKAKTTVLAVTHQVWLRKECD